MNRAESQKQAILEHLKSGRAITPLDALHLYRCFRLGGRIYDLKQEGYEIQTEMVEVPSGARVARYTLKQEKGQLSLI